MSEIEYDFDYDSADEIPETATIQDGDRLITFYENSEGEVEVMTTIRANIIKDAKGENYE